MATIKFLLQSKSDSSNIYVRYSVNRQTVLKRKTGFVINPKEWSQDKGYPIQKSPELKQLKSKLERLSSFVNDAYNAGVGEGINIDGDWLQMQIDIFNNKRTIVDLDVLTNYIQKYIDEAPYKQNQKKEIGLSAGRIQNLKLFRNTIEKYEIEMLQGKKILIKNINLQFAEKYKGWLFSKNYAVNYVGKNIANLKTICLDALKNDIETSTQLKNIKTISEGKSPEAIIYLSEAEQRSIAKAPLIREALINARKWLLLGCLVGQRGGDLLSITSKNIKNLGGMQIIELRQQKTGKLVAIPLLPEARQIIEDMPYPISLARFNEYIKDICKAAELDQMITARKKETSRNATVMGSYPKHELVTSHVCRRSFATNFYGRIPTPVLMNITAHGTEKMFLSYIGKTTYDNAFQMLEYFSKLTPRADHEAKLKVI